MSEKRKRGQNFTSEEKARLIKLIVDHKDTILNKKTDGATNEAKSRAWIEVTASFNSTGTSDRSKESLIKVWEKLKGESKAYYNATQRDIQTDGGPCMTKVDPILERVCAIIGLGCSDFISVEDNYIKEGEEECELPKMACLEESYNPIDPEIEIKVENVEEETNEEIDITPPWSRRRLTPSQRSFKHNNKKKAELEELKEQLLRDEINFKRKLYSLQLQAARKDVEIKNEILKQIRGGVLPIIQNMYGSQITKD